MTLLLKQRMARESAALATFSSLRRRSMKIPEILAAARKRVIAAGEAEFARRHRMKIPAAAGVPFLAVVVTALAAAHAQPPEFRPQVVIPRAFPAIKDVPVVSAAEADRLLAEQELVIGVVVNGKARAYPINMLTGPRREIINDSLGGHAIAATW